jgi:hypothetical protein
MTDATGVMNQWVRPIRSRKVLNFHSAMRFLMEYAQ